MDRVRGSFMTKEQLDSYLLDLRQNRPSRPTGSRAPPAPGVSPGLAKRWSYSAQEQSNENGGARGAPALATYEKVNFAAPPLDPLAIKACGITRSHSRSQSHSAASTFTGRERFKSQSSSNATVESSHSYPHANPAASDPTNTAKDKTAFTLTEAVITEALNRNTAPRQNIHTITEEDEKHSSPSRSSSISRRLLRKTSHNRSQSVQDIGRSTSISSTSSQSKRRSLGKGMFSRSVSGGSVASVSSSTSSNKSDESFDSNASSGVGSTSMRLSSLTRALGNMKRVISPPSAEVEMKKAKEASERQRNFSGHVCEPDRTGKTTLPPRPMAAAEVILTKSKPEEPRTMTQPRKTSWGRRQILPPPPQIWEEPEPEDTVISDASSGNFEVLGKTPDVTPKSHKQSMPLTMPFSHEMPPPLPLKIFKTNSSAAPSIASATQTPAASERPSFDSVRSGDVTWQTFSGVDNSVLSDLPSGRSSMDTIRGPVREYEQEESPSVLVNGRYTPAQDEDVKMPPPPQVFTAPSHLPRGDPFGRPGMSTTAGLPTPPVSATNSRSNSAAQGELTPQQSVPLINLPDQDEDGDISIPTISISCDEFDSPPRANSRASNGNMSTPSAPSIILPGTELSDKTFSSGGPTPVPPPKDHHYRQPSQSSSIFTTNSIYSRNGANTPMARPTASCQACQLPISGRTVNALGQRFHPQCFTCFHCSTRLEHVAFYPEPEESREDRLRAESRSTSAMSNGSGSIIRPACDIFNGQGSVDCSFRRDPFMNTSVNSRPSMDAARPSFESYGSNTDSRLSMDSIRRPSHESGRSNLTSISSSSSSGYTRRGGPLRFFCHLDYHELYSPRCKSCSTPIEGEVIIACGNTYHAGHFYCAECGDPFDQNTRFVEKDGYAWCIKCHGNRYSPKCKACKKPITDTVVSALGGEWHDRCFCCCECGGEFQDGRYFLRGVDKSKKGGAAGLPVCVKCEERRLKS